MGHVVTYPSRQQGHTVRLPMPPLADPWDRAAWAAEKVYRVAAQWRPRPVWHSVVVDVDSGRGAVLDGNDVVLRRFRIEAVDTVEPCTAATGTDG